MNRLLEGPFFSSELNSGVRSGTLIARRSIRNEGGQEQDENASRHRRCGLIILRFSGTLIVLSSDRSTGTAEGFRCERKVRFRTAAGDAYSYTESNGFAVTIAQRDGDSRSRAGARAKANAFAER